MANSRLLESLCLLVGLAWCLPAWGGEFVVSDQVESARLGKFVDYFRDDTDSLELGDILKLYGEGKLTRGEIDVPKFGVAGPDVALWFHIALKPELADHRSYILLLNPAYLRYVDIYQLDAENRVLRKTEVGQHRPVANRSLYHHAFPIKVTLDDETRQFVFRVKSNSVSFDLALYDLPNFFEKEVKERWFQYAYFGAMLIIFLHYCFIYYSTRLKEYLHYILYILFANYFYAYLGGYVSHFVFPVTEEIVSMHTRYFSRDLFYFCMFMSFFSFFNFMRVFLDLERSAPLGNKICGWMARAYLGASILSLFVSYSVSSKIFFYPTLAVYPLCFAVGVAAYRKSQDAKFFLLAFSFYLVGNFIYNLQTQGVLEANFLTLRAAQIGSFIEIVLFSASLAARMKRLQDERIETQQQAAQVLQLKVEERTYDLNVKTLEAEEATLEALDAKSEAESLRLKAEKQASALLELDKQKTAFFQNMSHELRTPLTLILNPLEAQSREQPDNRDIEVATKNSRRLLRLVNQLLDFQKIDAGKKKLSLTAIDLNRFTYVCGDYFYSACSSKDIDFSIYRDEEVLERDDEPIWVMAEIDSLEKVAFNYLSNALKYTPEGGSIDLGLKLDNQRVQLFVRDTGPGISEQGQKKLFEVFSQVDETTTRAYEGTGLGLALAKNLVEEMSGEVGVESAPGEGSLFWADFPLCNAPDEASDLDFEVKSWLIESGQGETGVDENTLANSEGESTDSASTLVLVVDDLPDMRELVGNSLRRRNYRVMTAPNGKLGVEMAQKVRPDLIITDWMMPQMTGPELIEELKADASLSSVPIVLVTAKSDEESRLIGTEIGADAFLGKPFNDQELGSIVKNLLSLKSREREVEKLNHMLTETVLKRYLPPALIEQIIAGELSMDRPAERRLVTILFSDLCGFTSTSEKLGPEGISELLNEYLSTMNEIIFSHGGTIDKFIGDAIMVMFGAPGELSEIEQAEKAVACAQDMQVAMRLIAKGWEPRNAGHLQMRIGIHQGDAIVGNFGSDKRSDYTSIGPTVNMASRIEALATPGSVFVSQAISDKLPDSRCEDIGLFELKGFQADARLYQIV